MISNKISFGEKIYKYFIGYLYNDNKAKPLHALLPKWSTCVRSYNEQTKLMYFLIEDVDLLKEYTICQKNSADIKKAFDSVPVYNKEFLKTTIKSHGDDVTDFYDKETSKVEFNQTLFSSNKFGFCSQKRWKLLSTNLFKRV